MKLQTIKVAEEYINNASLIKVRAATYRQFDIKLIIHQNEKLRELSVKLESNTDIIYENRNKIYTPDCFEKLRIEACVLSNKKLVFSGLLFDNAQGKEVPVLLFMTPKNNGTFTSSIKDI